MLCYVMLTSVEMLIWANRGNATCHISLENPSGLDQSEKYSYIHIVAQSEVTFENDNEPGVGRLLMASIQILFDLQQNIYAILRECMSIGKLEKCFYLLV